MVDYFLNVLLEVALEKSISLIQYEKFTPIQQIVISLH